VINKAAATPTATPRMAAIVIMVGPVMMESEIPLKEL